MSIKSKTLLKWLSGTALVILLLAAACWLWLSSGQLTFAKQRVFSVLPFPAALVNGRPLSMSKFLFRYRLAQATLKTSEQNINDTQLKQQTLSRVITEAQLKQIASGLGVLAGSGQIDLEYRRRGADPKQLATYGLTEAEFKSEVIAPYVTANNLLIWFYGQKNLNNQTYQTADKILTQLRSGGDFAQLAKTYSQDQRTALLGGDSGFISPQDLLPEVSDAAAQMQPGDFNLVPTRFGLQILWLQSRDNQGPQYEPRLHLRQILLGGSDFNQWYTEKTKGATIIKIVSL
ncbi:MAG: peptidylprolyl isomerase [Patescibacteria group bacterium]|nr:peptidylprolyl isomerase [Patescibacteria group bacterium]